MWAFHMLNYEGAHGPGLTWQIGVAGGAQALILNRVSVGNMGHAMRTHQNQRKKMSALLWVSIGVGR